MWVAPNFESCDLIFSRFGPVDDGGLIKRAKLSDEVIQLILLCHHDNQYYFLGHGEVKG